MKYFSPPLPTVFLLAIFVLSGIVGCNGQPTMRPTVTAALPTATTERVAETEAPIEEAVSEDVAEVETDGEDENLEAQTEEEETVSGPVSELVAACSAINIPSNPLIGEVSEGEWSKGSASAPLTLIEYGDFQ